MALRVAQVKTRVRVAISTGVRPENAPSDSTARNAPVVYTEPPPCWGSRPKVDILATTADSNQVRFGLAVYRDLMWATYPAISTDGGAIWRIGGPRFYVAAAQAASVTSSVGTLGSRGAYFWGQGGDVVDVTTNEGARWWTTGFAAGVYKVSDTRGTLRTVALGNQVKGGAFQAFLYLSTNSGRTWHLRGQLHNVMP